ncbi:hypothetical protein BGZ52_005313 [Haplosporangium bisporale]|nr:hypothetical protein BGZ52_005313 [Haplosporangium bisporale]
MNSLDQSNGGVEQFVKGLLQLKTLGHKLHRVYKLKNDQPDCRGILQALEKLVEQGCAASTLSKSMLADVFEMNTSPRKCNGLMTVGPIEVRNLKCKRVGASRAEVACQLKKNTKINKSILLQLQEYDLEYHNIRDRVPGTKVEGHLGRGQRSVYYRATDNGRRVQVASGGHRP